VRTILDDAGLRETEIFVSGDLNEWRIAEILQSGAPIDGFGVGAALSTSNDAPSLGAIYKLVEIEHGGAAVPLMKRSPGKHTYPGRKQVWRLFEGGNAIEDILELAGEDVERLVGRPLLTRVMFGGRRELNRQSVAELRARSRRAIAELPPAARRLDDQTRYPVRFGRALQSVIDRTSAIER
jgi:nicotinate phosphoribosyltransferase